MNLGPVFQQVQINFIFSDNGRIICLSCNVKELKTTAKVFKMSRYKCHSNKYNAVLCESTLILLPFLTVAQHESGTR